MTRKPNHPQEQNYHENQLLFILMSYRFGVDHRQKTISSPMLDAPTKVKQVSIELAGIFRQLKKLGWYIPQM